MKLGKFVVACTFRDFVGKKNDAIQHAFLKSVAEQTHPNVHLAVTLFGEKHVPDVIRDYGIEASFFETKTTFKVCGTEMWRNAASLVTAPEDLFFYTNVDHVFEKDFFEAVHSVIPPECTMTSFPQRVYDSLEHFERHEAAEDRDGNTLFQRGVHLTDRIDRVPPMFRMNPNEWLPDIMAVTHDLISQPEVSDLLEKYEMEDLWPGQAQNVMLGYLAQQGKRINLAMVKRYGEVLNPYEEDEEAVKDGKNYGEMRQKVFHAGAKNNALIQQFAAERGIADQCHFGSPLLKLEQISRYLVAGDDLQKQAFQAYLIYWKNKFLVHYGKADGNSQQYIDAQEKLIELMWLAFPDEGKA